jgi:hypothetical protein
VQKSTQIYIDFFAHKSTIWFSNMVRVKRAFSILMDSVGGVGLSAYREVRIETNM